MKVKIIGNGAWGNALYSVVKENNSTVSFFEHEEKATDADIVILSVPTQSIREVMQYLSFRNNHKIIVNTAKGIEKNTYLLPYQIVSSIFGSDIEYYSLIGPSFAKEVTKKMPTLVNLGYQNKTENSKIIKNLFQTNFFRVRLTKGLKALELSGAFKNIYAIACGLADGVGYGMNTRVKLLILAIEEMNSLFKNLNFVLDKNTTAGTIGDLILTCNSIESRNFTFGKLLAYYSVKQALDKINSTVEGFHSTDSVEYFKTRAKAELPLATFVSKIIRLNNPKMTKRYFKNFVSSI